MKFNRIHLNERPSRSSRPSRRIIESSTSKVQPKNKDELVKIIRVTTKKEGNNCDLNFIDTSLIIDMSMLFSDKYGLNSFNGDISKWNVSSVEDMGLMFA